MKTKQYKAKNKKRFAVTYGFERSFRKWSFRIGSFTLLTTLRGGKTQAEKLANALHASFQRTGKVDGPTRNMIERINVPHPLRDYRPDFNWT